MTYRDEIPEMPCITCNHTRAEHNIRHYRALPEVKDCSIQGCQCEKFYPEKLTIMEET